MYELDLYDGWQSISEFTIKFRFCIRSENVSYTVINPT